DYVGAGTVEFLMNDKLDFYFLEMNTRLQVEHPVSEWITGTDLVELQIRVARGEVLPLNQEDLSINGHALELRVYAEDPLNDFLPSVGHLDVYRLPVGEGIRVDNGFEEGMDIPIYYDPMLSKLITYGKTRDEAIDLMLKAIRNYHVEGIQTTLPFGTFVCDHEAFRSGNFDTHFVKKYYSPEALKASHEDEARIAALVALRQYISDQELLRLPN
ncbi:MAG: biotin carboxylase, partial [Flavobacteriaceae bacterium]|nr:biotin carboxylase [Flavobacteriaceae bacterium]